MPEQEINLVASSQTHPEAILLGGARSCKVDNINHNKDCIFFVLLCRKGEYISYRHKEASLNCEEA